VLHKQSGRSGFLEGGGLVGGRRMTVLGLIVVAS